MSTDIALTAPEHSTLSHKLKKHFIIDPDLKAATAKKVRTNSEFTKILNHQISQMPDNSIQKNRNGTNIARNIAQELTAQLEYKLLEDSFALHEDSESIDPENGSETKLLQQELARIIVEKNPISEMYKSIENEINQLSGHKQKRLRIY